MRRLERPASIAITAPRTGSNVSAYPSLSGSGADQSSADKQMMWTDHSEQSPYKDNIYVIWHDGRAVFVSHHTPGGGW